MGMGMLLGFLGDDTILCQMCDATHDETLSDNEDDDNDRPRADSGSSDGDPRQRGLAEASMGQRRVRARIEEMRGRNIPDSDALLFMGRRDFPPCFSWGGEIITPF